MCLDRAVTCVNKDLLTQMVCRDSYKQFLLHFQVYDTSIVPLSTAKHCFLLMLKTTCPDVGKGPFCF